MNDRVGQQLGNYRLLHLLGRGGFAEVYLGEHLYLKRCAALKVLHASLRDEDVDLFLAEAQTLARLDHPNIVRVHEFAVEQGTPFLVMDHAPGGTLRHRHPRGSCPSLATIVAYIKQIAAALQYAHNQHVIHRDVKPENMLLGPSQQVMLSDFGLALFSPSPEQLSTQAMVGTIPYMAPEQIRGKPTFASDQYALGVVVYEWLCGVRPFEGSPWQIAYQQVSVPPPYLRQQNPSLPQAVEDVVLKALAKDPRERHASVELFAQALEQAISDLPFEPRNPYKGLRAFTQADAADFFGRDTLIQELLDRVKEASTSNARLLTVIGASGSGKSSVVMAGLLPRLQQGVLPASQHWVYLEPLLPDTHPLEALALTLAPRIPYTSLKSIREDLEDVSARGLHLLATRLIKAPGQKVVLLIDQFEELFTLAISEQERQHFLNLLITAMTETGGSVIVLLTLRADCYDRPLAYPALSRLMEGHQKLVLPMEMADLRAVVMLPAALPDVQLNFEGDLVNTLLSEVQGQAGALPLLQFTLEQLFAQRSGHTLTLAAYLEIGGVKGSLARHAESTYAALPSESHRKLAHALFLRLINPGFTEQDTTRRRAALAELSLPDPEQTTIIQETADAFVAARLLTTNEFAGTTMIEVSHEALIREWTRLSDWLREAREDIHLQQTISADAADWIRHGKPVDRVYRGNQLAEAQVWVERNVPSKDEVAFLQAGVAERQRQETVEQSRQARELILQRRVMSRQRLLVTVLSIFSVIVLLLALVAEVGRQQADAQRQQAERQTQIANSSALAAQANYTLVHNQLDLALLLSVKANQTYNTYDARNSLLATLEYSPRVVRIIHFSAASSILAFSSGGQEFASFNPVASSNQGRVDKWDMKTGKQLSSQLFVAPDIANFPETFYGLAVSPDGQMFAATASEGLWVLNTKTDTQMIQLEGETRGDSPGSNWTQVAFSPVGKTLASSRCSQITRGSCTQYRILLWNVATKKPTGQMLIGHINGGVQPVIGMAFSYDGKMLASRDIDGTVQLWDSASRRLIRQFTGSPGDLTYEPTYQNEEIAFSPSGKRLALGNNDGTVTLWDVTSGKLIGSPLGGHTGPVGYVAFSPDGTILATGSHDTTLQLWNVATNYPYRVGQPLLGHTGPISSLVFSPDGKTLISGDGSAIIMWNMAADSSLNQKLEYTGSLRSAVFSSDGNVIIAGNIEGQIILREVATGKPLDILDATMGSRPTFNPTIPPLTPLAIEGLALSPNGHTLASGRSDGMILLWDMATRKPITHFSFETHAQLQGLTFNPNGRILAAIYSDGTILLWDIATGHVFQHLMFHTANLSFGSAIVFSPDGKLLASGDNDTMILWDIATGKQIGRPFAGHTAGVEGVAFSPDGHTLASLDENGTILLSDVETGKTIGQPLFEVDQDKYNSVGGGIVFSPNGEVLAAYKQTSVTLWDVTSGERVVHPFQEEDDFGNTYTVAGVTFSPNGQRLLVIASGTGHDHITIWDLNGESWQALACRIANRNFTAAEWRQFAMGEPYRKVCPSLPAG